MFLIGDLVDSIIFDVLDDLLLPQRRYLESFVLISLLIVCQEGGSFIGVLGGHSWFLTGYIEDSMILNIMDDLIHPKVDICKVCICSSLLEVCQEGGSFIWVLGGH